MPDAFTMRVLALLSTTAATLVDRLDADACAISRVIGDVLILVAESAPEGTTLQLGEGYLLPDYPRTQDVLATGRPYTLTLEDDEVDAAEASVLDELGFASLLMLSLDLGGNRAGLVEVYRREPRPFDADEVRRAEAIVTETESRIAD